MNVWQSLMVVVVVVVGQSEAFLEWMWNSTPQHLCQEICECPKDLMVAVQRGIDCVERNITYIKDGLEIKEMYPSISFARNHIKTLSSVSFSSSSSLISLDISENDLESLSKETFSPLQALRSLNLRNNNITSVDPEAFAGLQNLTRLDVSYNNIATLAKEVFKDLTSLEELYIGFNPLGTLNESLLEHTPALKTLDLSKLGLQFIPESLFLANLSNLETLSLAYNELHMVPTRTLHHLTSSLVNLDLSGNLFTSLAAFSFEGLGNLRSLTMEQMFHLRTIDAYAFGDLKRLESLILRYIPWIETFDGKAFYTTEDGKESSVTLSDFTFSYSSLHTLPEHLLPWDRLHYLSLQYNHWSCDCYMRWVKNTTAIIQHTGKRMICSEPSHLRGYHLMNLRDKDFTCSSPPVKTQSMFVFLVLVMVAGLGASLVTISMLVYWQRGWVCRRPTGVYTAVRRSGSTITITDEMDTTSEA